MKPEDQLKILVDEMMQYVLDEETKTFLLGLCMRVMADGRKDLNDEETQQLHNYIKERFFQDKGEE